MNYVKISIGHHSHFTYAFWFLMANPYCCQESWKLQACTEVYARYWKCMKLIIFICKIRFLHIMHHRSYRWVSDDIYSLFFKINILPSPPLLSECCSGSDLVCIAIFPGWFRIFFTLFAYIADGHPTFIVAFAALIIALHTRCRWVQKMNEWISPFLQSHHAIT